MDLWQFILNIVNSATQGRWLLLSILHISVLFIISVIFYIFSKVIKKFNNRITVLTEEKELNFYMADISKKILEDFEIDNVTKNIMIYLIDLTSSNYGVACYLDKKNKTVLFPFVCTKKDKNYSFNQIKIGMEKMGVLVNNLLQKKEIIVVNKMENNPIKSDLPENHPEIHNFIAAPSVAEDKILGFIIAGNKNGGYLEKDIKITQALSSLFGLALLRMNFEIELAEKEKRYRELFDTVHDMLYIYDFEGNILEANKAFYKLTGFPEEENRRLNIIQLLSGGRNNKYDEKDILKSIELIKRKGFLNGEIEITNEKREKLLLEFKNSIIFDNDGNPKAISGSARDITERKKLEKILIEAKEKAKESEKIKSNFIANISHEIRTPLNAILGFTDILLEEIQNSNHISYLDMIQSSGKLLLSIIDDILDLSKIESGTIKIITEVFNLKNLMENSYNRCLILIKKSGKDISLSCEIDPKIPENLYGDLHRLEQVLSNLLMNAVKFTPSGHIRFGVNLRNDYSLEFFVEDTGIGIPQDHIKTIFDRFTQVDTESKRIFGGTGLGLTISKMIIEMMGGEIYVRSKPGEGSKFIFTLPYSPAVELKNTKIQKEKNKPEGNKILIVEDNAINRTLLSKILEKAGYNIVAASDGFEAIKIFQNENSFDLVLMDIQMPGIDGVETLKMMRDIEKETSLEKSVPIIAISAHVMPEDIEKFLNSGFMDYVGKPFNREELLAKIEASIT